MTWFERNKKNVNTYTTTTTDRPPPSTQNFKVWKITNSMISGNIARHAIYEHLVCRWYLRPFCQTLILIHSDESGGRSVGRIAIYYDNLSCYFVFIISLIYVVYWQAHFNANYCNIHTVAIGEILNGGILYEWITITKIMWQCMWETICGWNRNCPTKTKHSATQRYTREKTHDFNAEEIA